METEIEQWRRDQAYQRRVKKLIKECLEFPRPLKKKKKSSRSDELRYALRRRREYFLERASFCCEKCGSMGELHLHHKKHLVDGGDNSEENIAVLCRQCHSSEHPEIGIL